MSAEPGVLPPIDSATQADAQAQINAKARRLLKLGRQRYRQSDHFDQPPEDLSDSEHRSLLHACQQFLDGKGFTGQQPLEDVGVRGLYILIQFLHFKVVQRRSTYSDGSMLDELRCQHVLTPETQVALFNKVS